MADNYLEQRMDDLRSGRLNIKVPNAAKPQSGARKGYIQTPFPSRRVLVAGGLDDEMLGIVRIFLRTGSKVAVFDKDKVKGERLALEEGIRFVCVDPNDPQALNISLKKVLKAWLDVDIVVINNLHPQEINEAFPTILSTWREHKLTYPLPSEYGGRIISIGTLPANCLNPEIESFLNNEGISLNILAPTPPEEGKLAENLAKATLFLAVPGNQFIDRANIPVNGK